MKRYFYIQVTSEELADFDMMKTIKEVKLSEKDLYIDSIDNSKWNDLSDKLEIGDIVYTTSIASISLDTIDFTNKLSILIKKKVQLCDVDDHAYHIEEIVETLQFLNTRAKYMAKQKQMEGIERSLEKKKNGEGRYGRPRIEVPANFEENVRYIIEQKRSLESYRRSLNIKKSTFYKLVRELRNSWERS